MDSRYDSKTDAQLLRATRRDPAAFGVFYDRHAERLLGWLERQTRDREVALDLTAETFAQVLTGAARYRSETHEGAAPWLYGIARHLLSRYWREQRLETRARARLNILDELRFDADITGTLDELDADHMKPHLEQALARLPEGQRVAVELRITRDLSFAEVARALACNESAARTRVWRGLRTLNVLLRGARP